MRHFFLMFPDKDKKITLSGMQDRANQKTKNQSTTNFFVMDLLFCVNLTR
jgi:hypothetical protein